MEKVVACLFVIAVLLSGTFMTHGLATGIVVPYQDPTPEQVAYERYHARISGPLFLASGVVWLVAGVAVALYAKRRLLRDSPSRS